MCVSKFWLFKGLYSLSYCYINLLYCVYIYVGILESKDEKRHLKVRLLLRKMCIYGFFC